MHALIDGHGRVIDYMRVSVTDRCNLRCIYCTPQGTSRFHEAKDLLSDEEIIRVVRVAARMGVKRVRLTGGEPLVREGVHTLIGSLNRIKGIEDISLTTNGTLLRKHARSLADAGLKRINVSLDSLKPEVYRGIRRGGELDHVLEGLREADSAGLFPIKINMVPIRGMNDDEIESFALSTLSAPFHVRFIELMPMGSGNFWTREKCVPTDEVMKRISMLAPLTPVNMAKSGPAKHFRLEGGLGLVGFISPMTHHFCDACNRLRLTSEGRIRPCLFSGTEIDIRSAMRGGASDLEIERLLQLSIKAKPRQHSLDTEVSFEYLKPMSKIGG